MTVDDVLILPRIARPDPVSSPDRQVRRVTTAAAGFEGEGFPVFRAFAGAALAEIDPFIHMDQMGEVDYAPGEARGTSWHPHRGFETVTYMIDGVFEHRDSIGGGGRITDGDTQWMTAGAGVLHIERPPELLVASGGLFHGVQLWVNLPAEHKWHPPRYQDLRAREAVLLTSPDGGALVRLIAGELAGHRGPGSTFTPITMLHATLSPGAEVVLPWRADFNALVYVLAGRGGVGPARQPIGAHQLAVLGQAQKAPREKTGTVRISAASEQGGGSSGLEVLVLGGRPIGEPVVHHGPFVMNTREEILQALEDFQKGRFGRVPAEALPHRRPGDAAVPSAG